jgi:hypothetical protein
MQTKAQILKPRIINAHVFSLERIDLNVLLNDFGILNE